MDINDYGKLQKAYDKLNLEMEPIINKLREMLETGEITLDMLQFEFHGEETIQPSFKVVYSDQSESNLEREVTVEFQITVRED